MQDLTLRDSLDALVAEHDRVGSPLRAQLGPGTDPGQVAAAFRQAGLTPSRQAVELFAWRAVIELERRVDFFWPASPLRLDEALAHYAWAMAEAGITRAGFDELIGSGLPPSATLTGFWRADWVPWLSAGSEEYAIECDPEADASTGSQVWRVNWHPDAGFETAQVATSVREFIDRVVALFRAGAYRWDPASSAIVPVEGVFERLGLAALMRP